MRTLVNDFQRFTSGTRYRPPLHYAPNFAELSPLLAATFEPSSKDEETCEFLDYSANELSLSRLLLADVLRCLGMSRTTSNGLLGIGGMFVLSTAQCRHLLRPPGLTSVSSTAPSAPPSSASAVAEVASANGEEGVADGTADAPKSGIDLIPSLPQTHRFPTLLDIGAGDGGVTAKLAPLFSAVYATEYSMSMRYRLRQRGYSVLDHNDPFHYETTTAPSRPAVTAPRTSEGGTLAASTDGSRLAAKAKQKQSGSDEDESFSTAARPATFASDPNQRVFDVISCLNVLDRADTPLTLLRRMRDALTPNGLLVLAVVLPWCPFVEYNAQQRQPAERLPMEGGLCCRGASFDESANKLVENVLIPCGFELVRWTKVPYLCMGNLRVEYAVLHDAVFILKRKKDFVDTAYTVSDAHTH